MARSLSVPRPKPLRASLTPATRRAEAKFAAIQARSRRDADALEQLFDVILDRLDARDAKRPAMAAHASESPA